MNAALLRPPTNKQRAARLPADMSLNPYQRSIGPTLPHAASGSSLPAVALSLEVWQGYCLRSPSPSNVTPIRRLFCGHDMVRFMPRVRERMRGEEKRTTSFTSSPSCRISDRKESVKPRTANFAPWRGNLAPRALPDSGLPSASSMGGLGNFRPGYASLVQHMYCMHCVPEFGTLRFRKLTVCVLILA